MTLPVAEDTWRPVVAGASTHIPVLAWALANTRGPILELGTGLYSTPLIHAMAGQRRVLSLESNSKWFELASAFAHGRHQVRRVSETWPDDDAAFDSWWGLVFVDQYPPEARGACIARLRDRADMIVVHDSELVDYYGLTAVFPLFKHVVTCRWFDPKWTTILSMNYDLTDAVAVFGV